MQGSTRQVIRETFSAHWLSHHSLSYHITKIKDEEKSFQKNRTCYFNNMYLWQNYQAKDEENIYEIDCTCSYQSKYCEKICNNYPCKFAKPKKSINQSMPENHHESIDLKWLFIDKFLTSLRALFDRNDFYHIFMNNYKFIFIIKIQLVATPRKWDIYKSKLTLISYQKEWEISG